MKFFDFFFSISPAVLRQATYGTIKFGTYYTLKSIVTERGLLLDKNGDERVFGNILCAVVLGATAYVERYEEVTESERNRIKHICKEYTCWHTLHDFNVRRSESHTFNLICFRHTQAQQRIY